MSVSNNYGDSSIVNFNVVESTIMQKVGVDRIESNESCNTTTVRKVCPDFADIVSLEAANANERR